MNAAAVAIVLSNPQALIVRVIALGFVGPGLFGGSVLLDAVQDDKVGFGLDATAQLVASSAR